MFSRSNPYRSKIIRGAFIIGAASVGIAVVASDIWKKKDKRLHKKVVIVGGGTAGVDVAAQLVNHGMEVTIIEPSRVHYYQAMWTLVAMISIHRFKYIFICMHICIFTHTTYIYTHLFYICKGEISK
jgi:hypothetical protein